MMGGGSFNWGPRIICDMLLEPVLNGSEVFLLDPDLAAAEEVKAACCKMNETLGAGFSFKSTGSEEDAFSGADFVVIAISTGGLDMMAHDLKIPEKYRIYQTVGDTTGPGGWNRTLRNVPVFAEAARKIERLAPDAIILNYTNPMAALTGTFYEVGKLRTVGLCHGIFSTYNLLERIFDVEEKDISLSYGGVNHFFWVTDFTVKGDPGYPLLAEKLRNRKINDFLGNGEKDLAGMLKHRSTLCDLLYRKYGMLTYIEDRHTCEFIPGYLNRDEACLKSFDLVRTTVEERAAKCANVRRITAELASGKREPFKKSRETAVDIIKAFISNKPFVDVVNLPNIGQIDNLPRGAVVETMGLVDSRGFTPLAMGHLPDTVQPLVEIHCRIQLMTLKAALEGDRDLALQALRLDPLCSHLSAEEVNAMGGELMDATAKWLPQFYGKR
jgi:alpha-galactosidase